MLNCYCQLSSSVIFRQYGVSQSECKIDGRPRPGLPRVSPRPHTEALGYIILIYFFVGYIILHFVNFDLIHEPTARSAVPGVCPGEGTNFVRLFTPGKRNALAKSKVHQISRVRDYGSPFVDGHPH